MPRRGGPPLGRGRGWQMSLAEVAAEVGIEVAKALITEAIRRVGPEQARALLDDVTIRLANEAADRIETERFGPEQP
jgi:hypothetical protein